MSGMRKKPATLHFTKIVNGEKTEFHICETCAREKGEMIPGTSNGFSIHNLLSGLLDFEPIIRARFRRAVVRSVGLTYSQFSKLGRFGCGSCYQFSEKLDPLFKRVHGNTSTSVRCPSEEVESSKKGKSTAQEGNDDFH